MRISKLAISYDLNANPQPLEIIVDPHGEVIAAELQRGISARAYDLFKSSGCSAGHALAHWLQAETELSNHISEIRESGPWLVVSLHLPLVPADSFKVFVATTRALVAIEDFAVQAAQAPPTNPTLASFHLADWPADVDPSTASAYLKCGTLTLEAKRSPASANLPERVRAAAKR